MKTLPSLESSGLTPSVTLLLPTETRSVVPTPPPLGPDGSFNGWMTHGRRDTGRGINGGGNLSSFGSRVFGNDTRGVVVFHLDSDSTSGVSGSGAQVESGAGRQDARRRTYDRVLVP